MRQLFCLAWALRFSILLPSHMDPNKWRVMMNSFQFNGCFNDHVANFETGSIILLFRFYCCDVLWLFDAPMRKTKALCDLSAFYFDVHFFLNFKHQKHSICFIPDTNFNPEDLYAGNDKSLKSIPEESYSSVRAGPSINHRKKCSCHLINRV